MNITVRRSRSDFGNSGLDFSNSSKSKMMRTKRQQNRSLLDSDEDESEDLMDPKKSKASDDNIHQGQQSSIPGINPAFQKALAEAGLILDPTNDLEQPHALNCEQV